MFRRICLVKIHPLHTCDEGVMEVVCQPDMPLSLLDEYGDVSFLPSSLTPYYAFDSHTERLAHLLA